MNILFLINPRAGRGRTVAIRQRIERGLEGTGVSFAFDECPVESGVPERIEAAVKGGFDVIGAVGGDGTVRSIGSALIGRPQALAVIPAGSGNGFARHLGIPMNQFRAALEIGRGRVELVDACYAEGLPFICTLGVGFDAAVAHRFAAAGTRGLATYIREGWRCLRESGDEPYEIEIDGQRRSVQAFLLTVANSGQYGNEARIAPHASIADGLLDLAILRRPPLWTAPLLMAQLFTGRIDESPWLTLERGQRITIRREAAGPAHLDGEPVTLPAEIRVEIEPQALRVVVPAATGRI